MKVKTKITISVLVLLLSVIAVVSAIVAIMALTQQAIVSNLSIGYYATRDVYATIAGGVYSGGSKVKDINMAINGDSSSGSLNLENLTIDDSATEKSLSIDFIITNNQPNANKGELYVTPKITTTSKTNIEYTKYVSFDDDLNYVEEYRSKNILVLQNQTAYIQYRFSVVDDTQNANLQGEITLNLYSVKSDELPSDVSTSTIAGVGHYPQTYVGNALNETLKTASLTPTGKTYTTDSAGDEVTLTEYIYNGKKVAKLEEVYSFDETSRYHFSNGEQILADGEICFFYVQPIKVIAVGTLNDNIIYETREILFSRMFDSSTYKWADSSLRTFLNGTFLTESGINAKAITIKNDTSVGNECDNADTIDKLWLPSSAEMVALDPHGDKYDKLPTDMAFATYCWYLYDEEEYQVPVSVQFWCRTCPDDGFNHYAFYDQLNSSPEDNYGCIETDGEYLERKSVCFRFVMANM